MPDMLAEIAVVLGLFSMLALVMFRPPNVPLREAMREAIKTFFLILFVLIFSWFVTSFTHFK